MNDPIWAWTTAPWTLRYDTLLGVALLMVAASLLGDLVWRWLRWPRLMGYGIVGTLLAFLGRGVGGDEPALRLAIDVALGLLLFEAGARLNLRWLARNPWLLATSLAEAFLTALVVVLAAGMLGVPGVVAAPFALIMMSVSPAIVQRVAAECDAAGQVTERLMALSALNTLYAVLALKLLSAGMTLSDPSTWLRALPPVLFTFVGSVLLGGLLGSLLALIARRLDLRSDNAVVLLISCVLLALVAAKTLHLSTLLVPLLAGIWLRNRHDRPWVWQRHFGSLGSVLLLVLFVAVASSWTYASLAQAGMVALARPSGLAWRQAAALGIAMLPVSGTAWVMALDFAQAHPAAGTELMPLMLATLAFVELLSPLVVMYALRGVGELDRDKA